MAKPKRSGSGFSAAKPAAAAKKQVANGSADHATKGQQAVALINQGKLQEAETIYRDLIAAETRNHITYGNLAAICGMQGRFDELIELLKKALQLKPNYPDAHNNLGNALKEQGDLDAAIASYNTALQLKPNYPEAHNNLGVALKEQGDLDAAIASYNTALQLKPNYPDAHWNSSLTLLLGSDYKNGWEKYEWRTKKEKNTSKPHALPKCDQWSDELTLNTTSQLLLVTEQGLGDTLQFMRYATTLRNEGISVSFCAQPKLHSLIKTSGIDPSPLTPQQANQASEGQWIPLLSVPRHLEVSPENPIITEPYIKTTEELHRKWAGILTAEQRHIIGINWQGNPKTEKTGLRGRSLALETFAPITGSSQIALLSLQKGFGSEQLETCSFKDRFISCQDQINDTWDFLETAAIIANCDLVITSDTSVAHLAGGMGKTTWLLLHKVPD
ncbi:MAG: tetratricopeptide repeat protein [Cyanobacteriota bacterium]